MKKTTGLPHQEKWSKKRKTAKNTIQKRNFLWIHSSCLLSLTQDSSCVIKRDTKKPLQVELAVMSPLMASTPTASTLHNPTEEPSTKVRGAICKAYREVKDPMDPNKWVTITDHLDSCGAFDLVQRQYLHDIKPAARYGMHPIRMSCLESTTDWYRDVGKDYVKCQNSMFRSNP